MTETQSAWFAGILDGEGSFMVIKSIRNGHESWYPLVTVAGTDQRLVLKCKELAGGKISNASPSSPNAKRSYIWQLTGKRLDAFLEAVIPYLLLKQEQAIILLHLRSEIRPGAKSGEYGRKVATDVEKQRRNIYRLATKALNHRGSSPIADEELAALAQVRQLLASRQKAA